MEKSQEIWRVLPQYSVEFDGKIHPKYEISNKGNVRRVLVYGTTQSIKTRIKYGVDHVPILHNYHRSIVPVSDLLESVFTSKELI